MVETFRDQVLAAAERPEIAVAVADVYAQLQREIDIRQPVCIVSGRCCRFEEYGHRLYVTTIELAAFVRAFQERSARIASSSISIPLPQAPAGMCPFQSGKLCGVHDIRPFGCRIFFCDPTATVWQQERYEQFHLELKKLHGELGVPYRYIEWRNALAELGFLAGD